MHTSFQYDHHTILSVIFSVYIKAINVTLKILAVSQSVCFRFDNLLASVNQPWHQNCSLINKTDETWDLTNS